MERFPRTVIVLVVLFQFVGANILFFPTKTVIEKDLEIQGTVNQNSEACCALPTVTLTGLPSVLEQFTWYEGTINMPWNTSSAITVDASVGKIYLAEHSNVFNFSYEITKPLRFYASVAGPLTIRLQDAPYVWTSSYTVTTKAAVTAQYYRFEIVSVRNLTSFSSTPATPWQTHVAEIQFWTAAGTLAAISSTPTCNPSGSSLSSLKDGSFTNKVTLTQSAACCPNATRCNIETASCTTWFQFTLSSAQSVAKYSWVTAYDVPTRDPISWVLYKTTSIVNPIVWTVLDRQTNVNVPLARKAQAGVWPVPFV